MTDARQRPSNGSSAYPNETGVHTDRVGSTPGTDGGVDDVRSYETWQGRTRVVLQPVAAPSVLGLFGFAGATMMVGAWQAGWYGDANTPLLLFPFCAMFGGLAQFLAGMWSYRARDGLATAMHGMWGSFWLAFGVLFSLVATKVIPANIVPTFGKQNVPFAMWFVALGVITALGTLAAVAESIGLVGVLGALAGGCGFSGSGFLIPALTSVRIGGWLFVASAVMAVYTAAAMMFEGSFGRTVLPLGKYKADANIPGRQLSQPLEYGLGQPGVKVGQ
jgi:succinate-acetate transporter protein